MAAGQAVFSRSQKEIAGIDSLEKGHVMAIEISKGERSLTSQGDTLVMTVVKTVKPTFRRLNPDIVLWEWEDELKNRFFIAVYSNILPASEVAGTHNAGPALYWKGGNTLTSKITVFSMSGAPVKEVHWHYRFL